MILMACDYALFVKGNNTYDAPRFIDSTYRNQSMEAAATLFTKATPEEEVVQLVKDIPQYLRALINNGLVDRKNLQNLPPKELAQQFGQDLGI